MDNSGRRMIPPKNQKWRESLLGCYYKAIQKQLTDLLQHRWLGIMNSTRRYKADLVLAGTRTERNAHSLRNLIYDRQSSQSDAMRYVVPQRFTNDCWRLLRRVYPFRNSNDCIGSRRQPVNAEWPGDYSTDAIHNNASCRQAGRQSFDETS